MMLPQPSLAELEDLANWARHAVPPTPQICWPLLSRRCGCEVWVKHENHNPTGSFKVRGGLVYLRALREREPQVTGVCAATRGNFGQSVAFAAARNGLEAVIVVPEGNSPDKNRAMQALGAELLIRGADFDESVIHAREIAQQRGLHLMPSFHRDLVMGVAGYSLELLTAVTLDRVYVPIGLGSGICGMIAARDALGQSTEIVGVVSALADTYRRSFESGQTVPTTSANTLADGLAVRNPDPDALAYIRAGVARVVAVSDDDVLASIGHFFDDTHNIAEGAGAAALAGLLQEAGDNRGQRVGVVLSGGNISRDLFVRALSAQ